MSDSLTLFEAFERHYDVSELDRRTVDLMRVHLRKWSEFMGQVPVCAIDDAMVSRFREIAKSRYSPATVESTWATIRAILRRLGPRETFNPGGLDIIARVPYMKPVKHIPPPGRKRIGRDQERAIAVAVDSSPPIAWGSQELVGVELVAFGYDPPPAASEPEPEPEPPPVQTAAQVDKRPAPGWSFPMEGIFIYGGASGRASRRSWQIIQLLATVQGACTVDEIAAVLWKSNRPERWHPILRVYVSNARKAIRKSLGIPANFDPIPSSPPGGTVRYMLLLPENVVGRASA